MTQKHLGILAGLPEKSADIRMAQYEAGTRTPKEDLTKSLANALGVSPLALNTPDIDSELGIIHTLFTLEDRYGLTIETRNGEVLFRIDPRKGQDAARLSEKIHSWAPMMEKLRAGEITREEYDDWRYNYPRGEETQKWAQVPSAEIMDDIVKDLGE